MNILLYRVILFGQGINSLKNFYTNHFGYSLIEQIEDEWVVLKAGRTELALHKIGNDYSTKSGKSFHAQSNTKLVFKIQKDITTFRQKLLDEGVRMQEIKSFEGIDSLFCDGEDLDGNVFQLEQQLN